MFYSYVEKMWKAGKISVGVSADTNDSRVYLEGSGIVRLALPFLSDLEKWQLITLCKVEASKLAREADKDLLYHYKINEGTFAGCYSAIPVTRAQEDYLRLVAAEAIRLEAEGKRVIAINLGK